MGENNTQKQQNKKQQQQQQQIQQIQSPQHNQQIQQQDRKMMISKSMSNIQQLQSLQQQQLKPIQIPQNIKEILQSINSNIDVESEVIKDVKHRIEMNEMNNIKFYDIMSIDNLSKKKGKGNFKSRRYPSDLAQIRGTKFYSKPHYNQFELERLKELKGVPGKQLLMSEIYSQLEENFEENYEEEEQQSTIITNNNGNSINQDNTKFQDYSTISAIKSKTHNHNQSSLLLPSINQSTLTIDQSTTNKKNTNLEKEIESLDHWYKEVKKLKKQQKILDDEKSKQADQHLAEYSKGKQSKFFPRQKQRTKTKNLGDKKQSQQQEDEDQQEGEILSPKKINERMRFFAQKNRDSVLLIAKKQFSELSNSKEFSPSQPQTPGNLTNNGGRSTPGSNSHANSTQSRVYLVELLKNNPNQDEETKKNKASLRSRSDSIRDIFQYAVKEINEQTKLDDIPSNIRELKKTVLKYVNDVPNFHAKEDNSFKKEDLTPEGIKRILHTFYTIDPDTENQMNMVEKAKNYEKTSNLVEQKLLENLRDTEALITNKSNTVRILRLENHTIMKKMRQIRELSQKLQNDLKEITVQQNSDEVNENTTSTTSIEKKSPDLKKLNLNLDSPHQSMILSKKGMNMMGSITTTNRSALIESVMVHTSRIHEIERENNILKESYAKFELKQQYNSEIVTSIEEQINQKRKDHKQLSKAKRVFLYEILKFGKDCRDEGLSWIIRAIQNLGEKVFDNHLPDFLDSKTKDFLLQKAQKIQEIEDISTLQNVSLDIYKTNMGINEHMRSVDAPDSQINDLSIIPNNNNISMMSQLNKSQNNNLTLPSIKNDSSSKMNQSFSQVDVQRIKFLETQEQKKKIMKNMNKMFEGLNQTELTSIEKTIDQLHTTKLTTNDIIYNETKKKIRQLLNTSMPDIMKKKDQPNSSFNQQQQNNLQNQTNNNNVSNFLDGLENDQQKLNHKIVLYENNTILNKYDSREQFIQEYEILSRKLKEKEKQLKQMEDKELIRVIKEYDYKNYEKRFGVKCGVVLSTLLGATRADREIIKNGMNKR